ncbi:MAG: sigma-54-dependent transcriptional regulator [Maricaulaceae bacterium]
MAKSVLIVDDDPAQRRLVQAVVEREGFLAVQADSGEQALDRLEAPGGGRVEVVLLDLGMPGLSGLETLGLIRKRRSDLPVIVLTAQGGIDTVVQAMQAGANDFFVKPASPERIVISMRNALKMRDLSGEVDRLKKTQTGALSFDDLIADAPAMRSVKALGQRVAQSDIPVLLLGESGVGKEVIARAIQGGSKRAGKPFVAVNCGAIPENLMESILFGHEKGAFTGAVDRHLGKFVEADGGTLFLDEVGELPLDMQVKLLRVLQEREVDPVGGRRPVKVDVRIISATNKNLADLVAAGAFREDLYYRLNVFPIDIPPLRERLADVPALVNHFVARFNAQEGKGVLGASVETLNVLSAFDWPGNVRQLENAVFRAVVLCDRERLSPADFPQFSGIEPRFDGPAVSAGAASATRPDPALELGAAVALDAAMDLEKGIDLLDEKGHLRTLEAIERDLIQFAIETYAGRMSEIARRLGIGRSTLYRKVREHDLEVDAARAG